MRWHSQTLDADDGALPGLDRAGFVRTVQTPEFDGITFHEVLCKSALNKMPEESGLPFRWTINPMRGCSHACRYCFARGTHEYLDLDAGSDFDNQIVVKTNIAAVGGGGSFIQLQPHPPVAPRGLCTGSFYYANHDGTGRSLFLQRKRRGPKPPRVSRCRGR